MREILIGACALSVVMLAASFGNWPYDYYTVMRFVIFCTGALAAYHFHKHDNVGFTVALGASALLFNPFAPLHLSRSTWGIIDLFAAGLFGFAGLLIWRRAEVASLRRDG